MKLTRIILLLFAGLIGSGVNAQSVLGGNITWECLGGNQYEVTFTLYRDCSGSPGEAASMDLYFYPAGCGDAAFQSRFIT